MSLGNRMQTQAARRATVVAAIFVWGVIASPYPRSLQGAGMVLTVGLLAVDVLLGITTGWLAFARVQSLDERQTALRDRAYRIAFRLVALGVIVMIVGLIVGSITTDHSGPEPTPAFGARWIVCLLELLAVMPTAVIAWLHPQRVDDQDRVPGQDAAHWKWVPMLAIPALASLWLLTIGTLPVRASAVRDDAKHDFFMTDASCGHFSGAREVAYGFGAQVRLDVEACWDGTHAWASRVDTMADLTRCNVDPGTDDFAIVTHQTCSERVDGDGTMHYSVRAQVSELGLAKRDISLELDITRDGRVLAFG